MKIHFKNRELNIPWEYFAIPFLVVLAAFIVISYRSGKAQEEIIPVASSAVPGASALSQGPESSQADGIYYDEPDPDDNPSGSNNGMVIPNQYGEAAASPPATENVPSPANKVNINKAGMDDLIALPYIGEVKARAIIDYRTANGPFKAIDDLLGVKGIGPKTLEKLRPFITLDTTGDGSLSQK